MLKGEYILSELIRFLFQNGLSNAIYDLIGSIGIITAVVFCAWYGRNAGIGIAKAAMTVTVVLAITFISTHIIILDAISFLDEHTSIPAVYITSLIRTFLLIPMLGLLMSKILKISWYAICDMLAFCPLLVAGIGCIGCLFAGCCRGYPWEYGIYNPKIDALAFPLPLLHSAIFFLIFAYLLLRATKNQYRVDGLSYPIMLILFGSSRFLTELLCDNRKIFWGISVIAIHALKDCLVGIVVYIMVKRRQKTAVNSQPTELLHYVKSI